jgi:hypothetical protein
MPSSELLLINFSFKNGNRSFPKHPYNVTETVTGDQCIEAEGHEYTHDLDCGLLGCDIVQIYGQLPTL